jgi:hypothetical protein
MTMTHTTSCACLSAAFAGAVALGGCGEGFIGPSTGQCRVRVVVGSVTDTILAQPPQPFVLEVRDHHGHLVNGRTVALQALNGGLSAMAFAPPGAVDGYGWFLQQNTDEVGRLSFQTRFAAQAGQSRVVVSVGTDSATLVFTILPGGPFRIVATPADTAIYAGQTYSITAKVFDRGGGAMADPVAFTSRRPQVALVSASGVVTTAAPGREYVVLTSGNARDSVGVSVVPHGVLAAEVRPYQSGILPLLYMFELDGSHFRQIGGDSVLYSPRAPYFLPSGDRIVLNGRRSSATEVGVFAMDTTGRMTALAGLTPTLPGAQDPQPSRDGAWVYFAARLGYQAGAIWRVHADGTGVAQVGLPWQYTPSYGDVSPSPDGTRLAVSAQTSTGSALAILDLRTGALSSVPGLALRLRWSPVADEIAVLDERGLRVMRPDGTLLLGPIQASHTLNATDGQIDWSPDGVWLVVCTNGGYSGSRQLALIRRGDGDVLPLPYTASRYLCGATWKP